MYMSVVRRDQERHLGLPWLVGAEVTFKPVQEPLFMFIRNQCCDLFGEVAPVSRDWDGCMLNDRWAWFYNEEGEGVARAARARSKWMRKWPRRMTMKLYFTSYEMIEELIPQWKSLEWKLRSR
jgi:hypothetical protein